MEKLVIVTGLSGSGLSSVLKTLEDLEFEVFDNFPPGMVEDLVAAGGEKPIAVGIDTRTRGFSAEAVRAVVEAQDAQLLFITCDDATLQKRFTETRRKHPLAKGQPITAGIAQERDLLKALQDKADLTIDTSELSIHDLRHLLEGHFQVGDGEGLTISLMSFGFRRGVPREADLVMDVRFLKNPHWVADLKPLSGLDQAVGDYIKDDADFDGFLGHFKTLLEPLLPRYAKEGKSYLTIAIGCTGGRHRSVFTIETLSDWLIEAGYTVHTEHRDLED